MRTRTSTFPRSVFIMMPAPVCDFDKPFEQLPIPSLGGDPQLDSRKPGGRIGQCPDHLHTHIPDIRFARLNGGQQVAHEAAADCGKEQFAAHGSGVAAALCDGPVDKHHDAGPSLLPTSKPKSGGVQSSSRWPYS